MIMNRYTTLPKALELEPHHQMQFRIVSRTPYFGVSYPLYRGYCQRILSTSDERVKYLMFQHVNDGFEKRLFVEEKVRTSGGINNGCHQTFVLYQTRFQLASDDTAKLRGGHSTFKRSSRVFPVTDINCWRMDFFFFSWVKDFNKEHFLQIFRQFTLIETAFERDRNDLWLTIQRSFVWRTYDHQLLIVCHLFWRKGENSNF